MFKWRSLVSLAQQNNQTNLREGSPVKQDF